MTKKTIHSTIDLIKYPIVTSKSFTMIENNQYSFIVHPRANKQTIKDNIEFLFDVKVEKVNTCRLPPKKRRLGQYVGTRPRYKKAIIKLKNDYKIDLFAEQVG